MDQVLKPVNIAGSLLVVQVFLLVIMTLGLLLNNRYSGSDKTHTNLYLIIFFAILSMAFVSVTADYYPVWSPILGDITIPTIERRNAFTFVFAMDLFVLYILISNTGGSNYSPFTTMLFLIPTLAIFLREPPITFISYSVIAYLIYLKTFSTNIDPNKYTYDQYKPISGMSHKFVTCACLALGVIVGYITRPIPINL